MFKLVICLGFTVALAACAGHERGLRDLRFSGDGPDEFRVIPSGALFFPNNLSTLPLPTPYGVNRADPRPIANAVMILGGNPNALIPNGSPASDSALLAVARRYGVDPAIRQTLASEDAAFRTRRARFGVFSLRDRYFQAYSRQSLDAYAELQRFRNAGVATPSAPPK